jgi:hypothetical protein
MRHSKVFAISAQPVVLPRAAHCVPFVSNPLNSAGGAHGPRRSVLPSWRPLGASTATGGIWICPRNPVRPYSMRARISLLEPPGPSSGGSPAPDTSPVFPRARVASETLVGFRGAAEIRGAAERPRIAPGGRTAWRPARCFPGPRTAPVNRTRFDTMGNSVLLDSAQAASAAKIEERTRLCPTSFRRLCAPLPSL